MRIAVYCSSTDNLPDLWQESARAVGRWIGANGAELVYGGIDLGLMRVVAETARMTGGKVTGVVPLRRAGMAYKGNDVDIQSADLSERKHVMQLLADVFVVLPGGYGTLDEFASAFAAINFCNLTHKRVVLFNPDGLYDHLISQLRVMIDRGLMHPGRLGVLAVVTTVDELVSVLDSFK